MLGEEGRGGGGDVCVHGVCVCMGCVCVLDETALVYTCGYSVM